MVNNKITIIKEKLEQYAIVRFFLSHTVMAFFYGTFLLLYEIKFLRGLIPALHPIFIAWAGVIALYDIFVRRIADVIPFKKRLLVFMALTLITALVNFRLGIISSVKSWVLTVLPLFAFYPVCLIKKDKAERDKALVTSMMGASVVVFLASAVALWLYIIRFSEILTYKGITELVGFRYYIGNNPDSGILLYGVYEDTNHAAVYALVFAVYSVILFLLCHKQKIFARKWQNAVCSVYAVVNFIVQICYFPLANSRGGWLCLVIAGVVCAFLFSFCKKWFSKAIFKRILFSALASVLCIAVVCGGLLLARSGMAALSSAVNSIGTSQSHTHPGSPDLPDVPTDPDEPAIDSFEKVDDGFGAGRLLIWKETLQLFLKHPVFGTNPGNSEFYADKYAIGEMLRYGKAVHNSYLDLLLDYGALGFLVMMFFWANSLVAVVKRMLKGKGGVSTTYYLAAFSVLLIAGCSAFLSNIFINTTAMYFIMLTLTGYLLAEKESKGAKV